MSYTLAEVAEKTGRPEATLRKLIERGQLHVEKEGNRTFVSQEALDAFMGAEVLEDIADEIRHLNWGPARALMSRLPDRVHAALLGKSLISTPVPRTNEIVNGQYVRMTPEFRPAPKPSKKKR